jgi:hypothetical protein
VHPKNAGYPKKRVIVKRPPEKEKGRSGSRKGFGFGINQLLLLVSLALFPGRFLLRLPMGLGNGIEISICGINLAGLVGLEK